MVTFVANFQGITTVAYNFAAQTIYICYHVHNWFPILPNDNALLMTNFIYKEILKKRHFIFDEMISLLMFLHHYLTILQGNLLCW